MDATRLNIFCMLADCLGILLDNVFPYFCPHSHSSLFSSDFLYAASAYVVFPSFTFSIFAMSDLRARLSNSASAPQLVTASDPLPFQCVVHGEPVARSLPEPVQHSIPAVISAAIWRTLIPHASPTRIWMAIMRGCWIPAADVIGRTLWVYSHRDGRIDAVAAPAKHNILDATPICCGVTVRRRSVKNLN